MKSLISIRPRSIRDVADQTDAYEAVAEHYYDASLHPTCAAFRAASIALIRQLVPALPLDGALVELGAGRASVTDAFSWWTDRPLFLVDGSPTMLAHSLELATRGATLVVADARYTNLESGAAGLVIAGLADPYNGLPLWLEIRRLLRPGGVAVVTTPSYAWATQFRPKGQNASFNNAEFLSPDGGEHELPSIILSREEQSALIAKAGLNLLCIEGRSVPQVAEAALAPKLSGLGTTTSYVDAYHCVRPD